jgi:hypothetical protein
VRISLKIYISIIALIACGCANHNAIALAKPWEYRSENIKTLERIEISAQDRRVIDQLVEQYAIAPQMKGYGEIVINKAVRSRDGKSKWFVFDIKYVEDSQVVYAVGPSGEVLDHFLLSSWR